MRKYPRSSVSRNLAAGSDCSRGLPRTCRCRHGCHGYHHPQPLDVCFDCVRSDANCSSALLASSASEQLAAASSRSRKRRHPCRGPTRPLPTRMPGFGFKLYQMLRKRPAQPARATPHHRPPLSRPARLLPHAVAALTFSGARSRHRQLSAGAAGALCESARRTGVQDAGRNPHSRHQQQGGPRRPLGGTDTWPPAVAPDHAHRSLIGCESASARSRLTDRAAMTTSAAPGPGKQ